MASPAFALAGVLDDLAQKRAELAELRRVAVRLLAHFRGAAKAAPAGALAFLSLHWLASASSKSELLQGASIAQAIRSFRLLLSTATH